MKKVALVVVLLLVVSAALFGASAYWFGMKAEQRYDAGLQRASQWGFVKFSNESYTRGIFSSRARTIVELQEPGIPGQSERKEAPLRFTLEHVINHGPLVFGRSAEGKWQSRAVMATIQTTLVLTPEMQNSLKEAFGKSFDPASIRDDTTVYFAGNGESHLVVPAFQLEARNGQNLFINWEGLMANLNFAPGLKTYKGSISAPGLEVKTGSASFSGKNFDASFDFHEGIHGLFFGDTSLKLTQFEFSDNEAQEIKHFSAAEFSTKTSSKESGDNVDSSLAIRFTQSGIDGANYGPGSLSLVARNIDAASVAKLEKAIRDLERRDGPQQSADLDQMLLSSYLEILPGLLKKSPEIELSELSIKSGQGDFLGSAKISFDGSKTTSIANPFVILNAIAVQAECSISEELLEGIVESQIRREIVADRERSGETPYSEEEIKALAGPKTKEQLAILLAQNIFVNKNGKYSASASYRNGHLILNGQPVPIQELMK